MRVKTYAILDRAVEEGIRLGWNRAHKHVENPDQTQIEDQIHQAVMGSICEVFKFDDDYNDD